MFKIYQITSILLIPVIVINLFIRIIRKKEDIGRFAERFGKSTINKNGNKKILWIHASSIGEFKSSSLIIERYYKVFHILVTTTTITSANYIKEFYNEKVSHQYIPFDISFWCLKFLNFWQPSLILWIESDIWPNMLKKIKQKKINCLYLNARVSPNSFHKWRYAKNLYKISLKSFDKIFAQSENDKKRIYKLTNLEINYIGNLKLANIKIFSSSQNKKKTNTLMIASTHSKEEGLIIKNIKETINKHNLKIYIAPRHLERINKIENELRKQGLGVSLESKKIHNDNDIIIIDSFGKLDQYFILSDFVILGGSFFKNIGGHNPLEPASYRCVVISGKYVDNWTNVYEDMLKDNSCIVVNKLTDMNLAMNQLLSNISEMKKLQNNALKFSKKLFFEKEELFKNIDALIK